MNPLRRHSTASRREPDLRAGPVRLVDVWTIALDVPQPTLNRLGAWLSQEERARAARFVFERDRRRFVVSHAALRAILAAEADCDRRELRFVTNAFGKPALGDGSFGVRFNLAHSGELALCAVTRGGEVGVDLEVVREVSDAESILRRQFAPSEVEDWLRWPGERRTEAFLRLWTCKEAWVKACGRGLSLPIDNSEIRVSPDAAVFRSVNGSVTEAGGWCLRMLSPAAGYLGAVCAEAPALDVRQRDWVVDCQGSAGRSR